MLCGIDVRDLYGRLVMDMAGRKWRNMCAGEVDGCRSLCFCVFVFKRVGRKVGVRSAEGGEDVRAILPDLHCGIASGRFSANSLILAQ